MAFPRSQIQALIAWLRRQVRTRLRRQDRTRRDKTRASRRGYPTPEIQSLIDWREHVLTPRNNVEFIGGPTDGFLCRPGELLVPEELEGRLQSLLPGELPAPTHLETVPILHYRSPRIQVRTVLRRDRDTPGLDESPLRIGPNLVFTGEQAYQGFPGGWPKPNPPESEDFSGESAGPIVAVLDTGYTMGVHGSLDGRFGTWGPPGTPEDLDITTPRGWRDFEAGHATFICGIIAQRARRAQLRLTPTLDSDGRVDEVELLRKIEELPDDVNIVNLSLGAFSTDDRPPVALSLALAKLAPETAVVAAAGNAGPRARPFWPAQLDHDKACDDKVIFAVGAMRADGTTAGYSTEPADLYAPGRSVSAFIEFDEKKNHSARLNGRDPQTFERYASWAGTSFATAVVAAAIAEAVAGGGSALAIARELCRNRNRLV
jgi:hypothetical protein